MSSSLPMSQSRANSDEPKVRGANRSTKVTGKLKVLPEQPEPEPVAPRRTLLKPPKATSDAAEGSVATGDSDEDEGDDEDETDDVEVYNQIARIPAGTARRDAKRLTKKKAKSLPRVTAYATASSYNFQDLMKFFNARRNTYHANARIIDDVIYTPYVYDPPTTPASESRQSKVRWQGSDDGVTGDLLGIPELRSPADFDGVNDAQVPPVKKKSKFDTSAIEAEIFLFSYGTVVIWGMTEVQEKRFLSSLKRFEVEKLGPDEVEMEDLNFYYANYSRIYNDVITLRKGSSYMTKLSLSHALSQSVKISLFEELISTTIEETKEYPEIISETGKIGMPHKEIMKKMGEVFLLRSNIASVGSVLDSPEVFWTYPDLQPLYDAARSYLELPQRINLLNTRVEVLQDMLQLLKESVLSRHSERLETIVIVLIGLEIVLGIITILVDLLA